MNQGTICVVAFSAESSRSRRGVVAESSRSSLFFVGRIGGVVAESSQSLNGDSVAARQDAWCFVAFLDGSSRSRCGVAAESSRSDPFFIGQTSGWVDGWVGA